MAMRDLQRGRPSTAPGVATGPGRRDGAPSPPELGLKPTTRRSTGADAAAAVSGAALAGTGWPLLAVPATVAVAMVLGWLVSLLAHRRGRAR